MVPASEARALMESALEATMALDGSRSARLLMKPDRNQLAVTGKLAVLVRAAAMHSAGIVLVFADRPAAGAAGHKAVAVITGGGVAHPGESPAMVPL
ncbi:hypothetical protein GGTG_03579 [Gaeumannomyces tritici R3-111a-1]|uniref:Uncharacterized protein n=1 Tax=Gaeumannomyces tritici (strain R3-111a-1) TaxID=644352 RepID=J3NQM3_GAET3|nr:hypothetical protein GGTG_03579 [Gaeumannomyces tritici R3-111a-1]EJT78479.1 hypothetical protein GGTG_03579 [Gaeumannomyces tritici R3-111a-1]